MISFKNTLHELTKKRALIKTLETGTIAKETEKKAVSKTITYIHRQQQTYISLHTQTTTYIHTSAYIHGQQHRFKYFQCFRVRTPVAARLTQPSILPRSLKCVAVLLMLRKCVGVVRIVRDPPVNSFGKSSSAHSPG